MAYDRNLRQRSADDAADALAARQHGVFRLGQIAAMGASDGQIRHRIASGRWEPVARGVYRLRSVRPSWEQTLTIALLVWGDGAAASHRSAAALWSFPGFKRRPIDITVPRRRRRTHPPPGVTTFCGALTRADTAFTAAIPVTTPARTLIDLAATAPRDRVEEALDDALRRTLVTPARMTAVLHRMRARPGVVVMRDLLNARRGVRPPDSVLATRLLRAIRAAGLPPPVSQYEIFGMQGRFIACVDFAYPRRRIVIEADGYEVHGRRVAFQNDRERDRALHELGWRVIRVTWDDVMHRPDRIAATVGAMLAGI